MKAVSLKLEETIFQEVEELSKALHTPRNRYINKALEHYNRMIRRELLAKQLAAESALCRGESMKVLGEFEQLGEPYD